MHSVDFSSEMWASTTKGEKKDIEKRKQSSEQKRAQGLTTYISELSAFSQNKPKSLFGHISPERLAKKALTWQKKGYRCSQFWSSHRPGWPKLTTAQSWSPDQSLGSPGNHRVLGAGDDDDDDYDARWVKWLWNRRVEYWAICSSVCSHRSLIHLLRTAPLRSRAPLRSFLRSLAHSLTLELMG